MVEPGRLRIATVTPSWFTGNTKPLTQVCVTPFNVASTLDTVPPPVPMKLLEMPTGLKSGMVPGGVPTGAVIAKSPLAIPASKKLLIKM